MSQWEIRLIRINRGDIDGAVHPWWVSNDDVSDDQSQHPIVRSGHASHAGEGSPRSCHHRIAPYNMFGAESRPGDESGALVVDAQHDDDAVTVSLAGEFDLAAANPVRETLTRALREPRQRLILDLREVTFIDSGGLHVILDAYKLCRCDDTEPTLTIRPGPPNVQRVFELTNLLDYLPFEHRD